MPIFSKPYGVLSSGEPVTLFALTNGADLTVNITNYGGIITSIETPDRNGDWADISLGKPNLEKYLAGHPYMGAICGRVAGRITGAQFEVDGQCYSLAANNGGNHIHGGERGLDKHLWKAQALEEGNESKLRLTTVDPDGANGYPGNLKCCVDYSLNVDNELVIDYEFSSDRTTPLAVTNHAYFNLKGEGRGTILDHEVQILADEVALCDGEMGLIDQVALVDGQPNDFRTPVLLSDRIDGLHQQHGDGYFLPAGRTAAPRLVARVRHPGTGRTIETLTTEPYLQFYTGAQMEDGESGKNSAYPRFGGFCLEAQAYPNSVNAPHLGDGVLEGGEVRRSRTVYRFSVS